MDVGTKALGSLERLGWKVERNAGPVALPAHIRKRYPDVPGAVSEFLTKLKTCEREDERVWLLTPQDYAGKDGADFPWDAIERQELQLEYEDAPDDSRAFWDAHLPIMLSVEDPYVVLSVVVDKAARNYGAVVRSEDPDFHETDTVAASFEAFLALIAGATAEGPVAGALEDLLLPPDAERRLRSPPLGLWGRLRQGLSSWAPFESYRVGVVVEHPITRPLDGEEAWSRIMRPLSVLIGKLPSKADIRREPKYGVIEAWAPKRKVAFDAGRGPEMFCLIDRDDLGDSQGLVLAIRKDVLRTVDIAADEVIFTARELMGPHKVENFDRTWGEFGRFGGLVINGLDATSSSTVLDWVLKHPKAKRMSFRARHNRPR
jgi:hypothetical protein